MFPALWVVTVLIVVLATVPAVAHALELPGKMRLSKDEYAVIQRVYYPGFTVAGLAEPTGILLILILMFRGSEEYNVVLLAIALAGLIAMQVIYWLITHRVNKVWVSGQRLGAAGERFFAAGSDDAESRDWLELRNRWEFSHVARAGCSVLILVALLVSGC
jgi:hypothetical protein